MTASVTPVLEGTLVRLQPLSEKDVDALCEVGLDKRLWEWTPAAVSNAEEMRRYVADALAASAAGTAMPFVIIERKSDRIVGSTRFGSIERTHRRVEIGWTWVGVPWQRTGVNREAKYLMLRHAFEAMGCIRVELKTDALNMRSRRAILGVGASEEGVLRRHMVTAGGRFRDTVYFSVISEEWPAVRRELERKLANPDTGSAAET